MKILRNVLLFLLVGLLYAPVVSAQNGAVVLKGDTLIGWYDWNGENVLAIQSSDSEAFCNADLGDLLWTNWLELLRPDGTVKYHERGAYFTRVFYPATPADFDADYCALWNNGDLMLAEGITHSTYNDNHPNAFDVPHKRRNVWGYNVAGDLYDTAGLCSSGMMNLNTVRRLKLDKDFPDCLPDDCENEVQVWKGPDLSCY